MHTFSMRPYCPDGAPNKCVNFVQESNSWTLSTFSKEGQQEGTPDNFGLVFHSPLESIDMTVVQLAALIAGVDAAYEELCNSLYAAAPEDLAGTPWHDLTTFMECIPRGMFEKAPELPWGPYSANYTTPFLYNAEIQQCLVWTGYRWGLANVPEDVATYDSAGTCFGWNVLYKEDTMSAECARTPEGLEKMVGHLMDTLAWLDTDAKVYVRNIYSVR